MIEHTLELALAAHRADDFAEAERRYRDVLAADPRAIGAQSNLGNVLQRLGRLEEALACHDAAAALAPDRAAVHYNRALVLRDLQRLDEAIASDGRALALEPGYAEARRHQRLCRLLLAEAHWNERLCAALICDDGSGWNPDEWRRRKRAFASRVERAAPICLGDEDVAGKTLLLHAGDGLGNTLQFCRYADWWPPAAPASCCRCSPGSSRCSPACAA